MKKLISTLISALVCVSALSATQKANTFSDSQYKSKIEETLSSLNKSPSTHVYKVLSTPINSMYGFVTMQGTMYIDYKHKVAFYGELIDLKTGKDLSEEGRQIVNKSNLMPNQVKNNQAQQYLENLPGKMEYSDDSAASPNYKVKTIPKNSSSSGNQPIQITVSHYNKDLMFIYPAKGKKIGTITVFGAMNCPFCHRLYKHTKELQNAGISVHYIFIPRDDNTPGMDREAIISQAKGRYGKQEALALCSKNKSAALGHFMGGKNLTGEVPKTCNGYGYVYANIKYVSNVLKQTAFPYVVLSNGKVINGVASNDSMVVPEILNKFHVKNSSGSEVNAN